MSIKQRYDGNAALEYVLPLSIFFVVFVAILLYGDVPQRMTAFLEDNTNGEMKNGVLAIPGLGPMIQAQMTTATITPITPPPTEAAAPAAPAPAAATAGAAPVQPKPAITATVPLDLSPQGTETVGGLGGAKKVKTLAERIQATANAMQAQGAPGWMVSYISNLANEGHRIGGLLTDSWTTCPPTSGCTTSNWTTFGSLEARAHLVANITPKSDGSGQWSGDNGVYFIINYNAILTGNMPPEVGDSATWKQALAQYPEARAAVVSLSQELMSVAKQNAQQFMDRAQQARKTGLTNSPAQTAQTPSVADVHQAPATVHQDSNNICITGGDGESCIR